MIVKEKRRWRVFSLLVAAALLFTSYAFVLPMEAEAIGVNDYVYGNYYSYPAGTTFITSLNIGASRGNGTAKDRATRNDHPNRLEKDLNDGAGGSYVYLAYRTGTTITDAICYLRNSHSLGTGATNTSLTVNGVNPTFTSVPGNDSQDLNRRAGGDTIILYGTQDARAGLPIVALAIDESSTKSGYATVQRDNTGEASDCNRNAGGAYIYIHFDNTSVYTDVTTQINAMKTAINTAESLTQSNYTTASWSTMQTALSSAKTILAAFDANDWHAATYTATQITAATTTLNNALNALQTTITIDAATNGGICASTSYTVTCGTASTVSFPAGSYTATKSGWDFLGWATSSISTTGSKSNMSVSLASTVYAIFRNTVTGVFHYMTANGTDTTYTANSYIYNTATAGNVTGTKVSAVSKGGRTYTFAGWATSSTAITPASTSDTLSVALTQSPQHFYATYTVPVSLLYDANGGVNAPEATTGSIGVSYNTATTGNVALTVTSSVPSRTGYTFIGWADTSTATSARYSAGSVISSLVEDKTIYAVWNINYYTVTFINSLTGATEKSERVAYGGSATAPTMRQYVQNDNDTHYTFAGWDKSFSNISGHLTVNSVYTTQAHTWGEWTVTKQATCTEAGSQTHTCTACGATETQPIAALGHSYKHVTVASTCTVAGVEYDECERCGDVINETPLPLLAHTWGAWTEVTPATCEGAGSEKRACSACGAEETQPIAALGHSYKHVTVASTCTVAGVEYDECERCGDVINETLLPLAACRTALTTV